MNKDIQFSKVQQSSISNGDDKEIPYSKLLTYSSKLDKLMMIIGTISAVISGASYPVLSILTGQMISAYENNGQELIDDAINNSIYFIVVGVLSFFIGFTMLSTWMITGEKQGAIIRKNYLKAIMSQEVAWFDQINPNTLASNLITETLALQGAIGEKIPVLINNISATIFGLIVGLIYGWKLALVIFGMMPVAGIFMAIFMKLTAAQERSQLDAYSKANGLSEQAISAIKTVKSLTGEDFEFSRYSQCLQKAAQNSMKYHLGIGISFALLYGQMMWSYSLGFWYGSKLIIDQTQNESTGDKYTVADIITTFYSIGLIGYSIGQIGPCLTYYAKGKEAAKNIFQIIERIPQVNDIQDPIDFRDQLGDIKFENVSFSYPHNPEKLILNNINLIIPKGKKVALVGESGCGKSTIIQLIERFYDCTLGQIFVSNNINIKDIDINKYRQKIGMVGQEPVLFATSIRENIKYSNPNLNDDQIINILKMVNAWEFIQQTENQLNTYVGVGGHQLSGGQKQRIAIARALINQPQLLLLDEATSALDRTNEKLIQQTLDKISKGITTLIIAHRLKTIQDADLIYVLDKGTVCEQGTHQQLIELKGKYYELANKQNFDEHQNGNEKIQDIFDQNDDLLTGDIKINVNQQKQTEQEKDFSNRDYMNNIIQHCQGSELDFFLGTLASICNGCTWPIFSMFYGMILQLDLEIQMGASKDLEDVNPIIIWIALIGIITVLLWTIQTYYLNKGGDNLTQNLERESLQKNIENAYSLLTQFKLSIDCKLASGLIVNWLKVHLQNISAVFSGIMVSLFYSWQLGLIMIVVQPTSYLGSYFQGKFVLGYSDLNLYRDTDNLIQEVVNNIRTVKSLNNEKQILRIYENNVQRAFQQSVKRAIIAGVAYGYSQMQRFFIAAFEFYIGSLLVVYEGQPPKDIFVSIYAIQYAVMSAGDTQVLVSDDTKAKEASKYLFQLLECDDEQSMNCRSEQLKTPIKGKIEIKNLKFKYPTRDQIIFENLDMSIKQGDKVGLVGMSGCGKSTLIQLLLRFYEPQQGEIFIDDVDIKQYDLQFLRQQFSIVTQEPVLFQGTIKDNIIYNLQNVSEQQIQSILIQTNLLGDTNQLDINRDVGNKGNQISGGQKQRIAIARALLRNNQILILDEATSALDSQNEQIIQEQLNQIMINRTSIVIAHRISTIQDSRIFVLNRGLVEEEGIYQDLMNKLGLFYSIYHGISTNQLFYHLIILKMMPNLFRKDSFQQDCQQYNLSVYMDENGQLLFTDLDQKFKSSMEMEFPKQDCYPYAKALPDDEQKKETVLIQNNPMDEEKQSNQISDDDEDQNSGQRSEKKEILYDLSYSLDLFPGDLKNLAKNFITAMQKFIEQSFQKQDIEENKIMNDFYLEKEEKNKDYLIKFLNTEIGYQFCQFYFGNFKFARRAIMNKKVKIESLIKAIKIYFIQVDNL
ncbi:hypothetical protein pb186bvf_000411 [Paramecium bursaria]